MDRNRRLAVSLFAATLFLGAVTVGLASLPPRPLRSALTVVYTLSVRVATDWLAVLALLAVADAYVRGTGPVDRPTVRRPAAVVFFGGLAVEASPFVRLVVEPASVSTERLVTGLVAAVQGALFPAGLVVATVVGAATLRDGLAGPRDGLPLAASSGLSVLSPAAVWRAVRVLAAVAGGAFAVETAARLALGESYVQLVLLDAAVGALGGLVEYGVLAVAFLVLVVDGATVRSLVRGVVGVWAALFGLAFAVAAVGAALGVALVGATTTPMAAVEASTLSAWPTPDSWAILLGVATFVAGGVGLAAIQRTTPGRRRGEAAANDPQDA